MTITPAMPVSEPQAAEPEGSDMESRLKQMTQSGADLPPRQRFKKMLRHARLRPTNQRMALANILFAQGNRHVTAEVLYDEAVAARIPLSLATVYNTLRQFTEAGLLRQISVGGSKSYFDTNPDEHHHFFVQDDDALLDIPGGEAVLSKVPQAPEGFEIVGVAVVVRLRRKRR